MARNGKARGKRVATLEVKAATANQVRAGFSTVVHQETTRRSGGVTTDGKSTPATAFPSSAAATKA